MRLILTATLAFAALLGFAMTARGNTSGIAIAMLCSGGATWLFVNRPADTRRPNISFSIAGLAPTEQSPIESLVGDARVEFRRPNLLVPLILTLAVGIGLIYFGRIEQFISARLIGATTVLFVLWRVGDLYFTRGVPSLVLDADGIRTPDVRFVPWSAISAFAIMTVSSTVFGTHHRIAFRVPSLLAQGPNDHWWFKATRAFRHGTRLDVVEAMVADNPALTANAGEYLVGICTRKTGSQWSSELLLTMLGAFPMPTLGQKPTLRQAIVFAVALFLIVDWTLFAGRE